jgi:hypothetical protein
LRISTSIRTSFTSPSSSHSNTSAQMIRAPSVGAALFVALDVGLHVASRNRGPFAAVHGWRFVLVRGGSEWIREDLTGAGPSGRMADSGVPDTQWCRHGCACPGLAHVMSRSQGLPRRTARCARRVSWVPARLSDRAAAISRRSRPNPATRVRLPRGTAHAR